MQNFIFEEELEGVKQKYVYNIHGRYSSISKFKVERETDTLIITAHGKFRKKDGQKSGQAKWEYSKLITPDHAKSLSRGIKEERARKIDFEISELQKKIAELETTKAKILGAI